MLEPPAQNQPTIQTGNQPEKLKKFGLALFLTIIMPGLGYFYIKDKGRGIKISLIWALLVIVLIILPEGLSSIASIPIVLLYAYAFFDIYKKLREEGGLKTLHDFGEPKKMTWRIFKWSLIVTIILIILTIVITAISTP